MLLLRSAFIFVRLLLSKSLAKPLKNARYSYDFCLTTQNLCVSFHVCQSNTVMPTLSFSSHSSHFSHITRFSRIVCFDDHQFDGAASCCPKRARGPPIGIFAALTGVPAAGESPFGIGRCHRIRTGSHLKRRRSASLEAVRSFITLAT
jgi:hypothetical protein